MSEPTQPLIGMCGRCYADDVELYEPKCDEDPRDLAGQPIGQYHCPDCGAMVLAGIPHPKVCKVCLTKTHPGFDIVADKCVASGECSTSTGICGRMTFGAGKLEHYGYWEVPCLHCAREFERNNPEAGECWPPKDYFDG